MITAPSETLSCPLGLDASEKEREHYVYFRQRKDARFAAALGVSHRYDSKMEVTVSVMCGDGKHRVRVSDRGAIAFLDHSRREIANLVTLRALGDKTCGCLNVRAWLVGKKPEKRFEIVTTRWRQVAAFRREARAARASAKPLALPRAPFEIADFKKRASVLREEWLQAVLDRVPNAVGRPFPSVTEPQEIVYGLGAENSVEAYFLPVYATTATTGDRGDSPRVSGTRAWRFSKVGLRVSLRATWLSAFRSGLGVFNSRFILGYERTPTGVVARIACPVLARPGDRRDPPTPRVEIASRRLVRVGVASYALAAGEEPLP